MSNEAHNDPCDPFDSVSVEAARVRLSLEALCAEGAAMAEKRGRALHNSLLNLGVIHSDLPTAAMPWPQVLAQLNFEYDVDGVRYRAAVSRFEDGHLAEIFLDGPKTGSAACISAHDAAVAASLALQFGCPAKTLRHALLKVPGGESAGPLGRALDLTMEASP